MSFLYIFPLDPIGWSCSGNGVVESHINSNIVSLAPHFYRWFIDPMTASIRRKIVEWVPENSHILDIASGTGALCFNLAPVCQHVTGIDNAADMIRYSHYLKKKRGLDHLEFNNMDATAGLNFKDQSFNLSILSMAIHQFPSEKRAAILSEALRVSRMVIVADYSVPLPRSMYGFLARSIEKLAGGEHYQNFLTYYSNKGLRAFLKLPSIELSRSEVFGGGIFSLVQITNSNQVHGNNL